MEIYFEPTSYTWRMMKFLEAGRAGTFDFVYRYHPLVDSLLRVKTLLRRSRARLPVRRQ